MTDTGIARADLLEAAAAAALALAASLGLGDSTQPLDDWPVEPGDPVLRMELGGDGTRSLVLGVNAEMADQLAADPAVLSAGFGAAIDAINSAIGSAFVPAAVDRTIAERPEVIIGILDGDQLTAAVGLSLSASIADPSTADPAPGAAASYQPTSFDGPVSTRDVAVTRSSLSVLHDVELVVTAELGRTTMPVRDLLGLTPGMVVEIDRAAGAPIDLLVNGRRIAAGEVVVIDEEFGIRITEIAPIGEQTR